MLWRNTSNSISILTSSFPFTARLPQILLLLPSQSSECSILASLSVLRLIQLLKLIDEEWNECESEEKIEYDAQKSKRQSTTQKLGYNRQFSPSKSIWRGRRGEEWRIPYDDIQFMWCSSTTREPLDDTLGVGQTSPFEILNNILRSQEQTAIQQSMCTIGEPSRIAMIWKKYIAAHACRKKTH